MKATLQNYGYKADGGIWEDILATGKIPDDIISNATAYLTVFKMKAYNLMDADTKKRIDDFVDTLNVYLASGDKKDGDKKKRKKPTGKEQIQRGKTIRAKMIARIGKPVRKKNSDDTKEEVKEGKRKYTNGKGKKFKLKATLKPVDYTLTNMLTSMYSKVSYSDIMANFPEYTGIKRGDAYTNSVHVSRELHLGSMKDLNDTDIDTFSTYINSKCNGGSLVFDTKDREEIKAKYGEKYYYSPFVEILVNCIAVYVKGELKCVIDPQGSNYARYTYLPTSDTTKTDRTYAWWREGDNFDKVKLKEIEDDFNKGFKPITAQKTDKPKKEIKPETKPEEDKKPAKAEKTKKAPKETKPKETKPKKPSYKKAPVWHTIMQRFYNMAGKEDYQTWRIQELLNYLQGNCNSKLGRTTPHIATIRKIQDAIFKYANNINKVKQDLPAWEDIVADCKVAMKTITISKKTGEDPKFEIETLSGCGKRVR